MHLRLEPVVLAYISSLRHQPRISLTSYKRSASIPDVGPTFYSVFPSA